MHTKHLESMGDEFVEWDKFKEMLKEGINLIKNE